MIPRIYEAGICPSCGSEDLDFNDMSMFENVMSYRFTCNECQEEGLEVYSITYQYTEGENNGILH